jgi:hypothetical protein
MKRISLVLIMAGMIWTIQTAKAQTQDTTKNSIEIKKKVKKGAHGRTVTKIKMEGTGTPDAIKGAADGAVTGHLPTPAPIIVTPSPAPVVVVVHDTVRTPAPAPVVVPAPKPTPTTTEVTTTTETKPAAATISTTHHVTHTSTSYRKPVHAYHKKTTVTPAVTKTTTTTTVKKNE